jgi:ElaB/YqjD/DUF883 family membrane-anchored ribosome-binding protein
MADNQTGAGDAEVTFQPEPKLTNEAASTSGEADVAFEADSGLGEKKTASQTIKDEANRLGGQAADRARALADEGKTRATTALDEFSRMMTDAAGTVDEKLGAQYGQYARTAADSISGFAETLRAKDVDDLVEDATAFVKKSPAIAIGVAAAVGFVLARVVKSGVDAASDASGPATKA